MPRRKLSSKKTAYESINFQKSVDSISLDHNFDCGFNYELCRVCMESKNQNELKHFNDQLVEFKNLTLLDVFNKVTQIGVSPKSSFLKICIDCQTILKTCFIFITKSIESNSILEKKRNNFVFPKQNLKAELEEDLIANEKLPENSDLKLENVKECERVQNFNEFETEKKDKILYQKFGNYFQCKGCEKIFATELSFSTHLQSCLNYEMVKGESPVENEAENDFRGDINFINLELEQSDMLNLNQEKKATKLKCTFCKKTFRTNFTYKRHMIVHNSDKPFECEKCKYRFVNKYSLKRHQLIKHGINATEFNLNQDQIKKCQFCDKKFFKQVSLAGHMKIHKDGYIPARINLKLHKCYMCSKSFLKFSSLGKHLLEHEYLLEFKCTICNKQFSNKEELRNHFEWHRENLKFVCQQCKRCFEDSERLQKHMKTHTKRHLCPECGKSFHDASYLRHHLRRHAGEKIFHCQECPGKYATKGNLDAHMITHTKIKPFRCEICNTQFTKKYGLNKHMLIHTGEKPYNCQTCSAKFKSSYSLKRHMLTHTGEKPHACQYCTRAFAQKNDLVKHLKTHLGDKIYKCEMCAESFRLQTELREHIYDHYKKRKQSSNNEV